MKKFLIILLIKNNKNKTMQISQTLPQFEKKSLLVVAGRRVANFYCAYNGEINKIDSIEIEEPQYSDKEGFFVRMGKGQIFGRGSVLEDKKMEINKKFFNEVKEKTENIVTRDSVENIYLFAPDFVEKSFPGSLSGNVSSKIVFTFRGNFLKKHLFDLIKKIENKSEKKKPKFMSEAAMKILKKKK